MRIGPVAFYAITALSTIALLQCYCLSIACVLWRRVVHPETLPPAEFSLGRWGVPINALAVVYSLWAFFWACWPQEVSFRSAVVVCADGDRRLLLPRGSIGRRLSLLLCCLFRSCTLCLGRGIHIGGLWCISKGGSGRERGLFALWYSGFGICTA